MFNIFYSNISVCHCVHLQRNALGEWLNSRRICCDGKCWGKDHPENVTGLRWSFVAEYKNHGFKLRNAYARGCDPSQRDDESLATPYSTILANIFR